MRKFGITRIIYTWIFSPVRMICDDASRPDRGDVKYRPWSSFVITSPFARSSQFWRKGKCLAYHQIELVHGRPTWESEYVAKWMEQRKTRVGFERNRHLKRVWYVNMGHRDFPVANPIQERAQCTSFVVNTNATDAYSPAVLNYLLILSVRLQLSTSRSGDVVTVPLLAIAFQLISYQSFESFTNAEYLTE